MPEPPEAASAAARKLYVSDPGMEVFEFEALLDAPDDPRLAPPPPPAPKPKSPAPKQSVTATVPGTLGCVVRHA